MKSLVRIIVENWLTYTRLSDPRVDDDDACRQIEMVNRHIVHADLEMNELFLRVIQEMADESRDGDDEERTDMLDAMPAEIGVSLNED